jgi:hypothetical protein
MLDQLHDLVPLGRAWEFLHDQAAILMTEIERQFRNTQVAIFGVGQARWTASWSPSRSITRSIGWDNAACGEQITANHACPAEWI